MVRKNSSFTNLHLLCAYIGLNVWVFSISLLYFTFFWKEGGEPSFNLLLLCGCLSNIKKVLNIIYPHILLNRILISVSIVLQYVLYSAWLRSDIICLGRHVTVCNIFTLTNKWSYKLKRTKDLVLYNSLPNFQRKYWICYWDALSVAHTPGTINVHITPPPFHLSLSTCLINIIILNCIVSYVKCGCRGYTYICGFHERFL